MGENSEITSKDYLSLSNTTSLGGQYYTSYTADEASSSSYWKLELDDLQRSHIQKILAFGYPQVDYGYSRQVQYAATQVLIWEVVSHSRVNADIKSCTDYGLYSKVYAVLGADFQSCYDGILNAISVSDGTVPSFAGASQSGATPITLTLNNTTNCYEGSVRDNNSVLSHFTFSASGVIFSRSGNTLYISVPASGADAVKGQVITGTSDQKLMSTSNPTIWENPTYQTGADRWRRGQSPCVHFPDLGRRPQDRQPGGQQSGQLWLLVGFHVSAAWHQR